MVNKLRLTIAAICISSAAFAQNIALPAPKLSPLTRILVKTLDEQQHMAMPQGYIYKTINGKPYLSGMIKVSDMSVATLVEDMGVLVGTKAKDIWTVNVPLEKVKEFTQLRGISYIQLDEPLRPAMDAARRTTRVDSVHMGVGLIWPMNGLNVVTGIIDFGFDYGHPIFFDTSGTKYRVKKVWEPGTTGTPPAGYAYGHELSGDATIQGQGTDNPAQMHGTAVAGIAAGSGYGVPDGKLRGMAFRSDMVLVGVRRDAIGDQWMQSSFSDFADGVNYIFDYANSVSKPAVVNISWGSQSGPHDGTSLFSQACDNLSGQGRMIVMSAGNDGEENIHIAKTFASTDSVVNTYVTFSADAYKRTWIDIWGDTAKTFCANLTIFKNGVSSNTGYICIDDQLHKKYLIGANGLDTCFVDFINSSSEYNDKPRMTLNIYNKAADSIMVSVKGFDGSIDMWNEYYYYGYTNSYSSIFESFGRPDAVAGNTASTVSDMGSAKSVLLVGAYASKHQYKNLAGTTMSLGGYVTAGKLVPFSSRGPMADGRIKPDITAPGVTLATGVSSFDTRYSPGGLNAQNVVAGYTFNGKPYYYAEFIGTSASAPAASGIVALMLQANPKLTSKQIHDIITQTAIQDNFTGTIPTGGNNNWGHGKINAYAAVKAALQSNSIYDFKGQKLDCVLFPNPNNGKFTISYTGTKTETLSIAVYDIKGSLVHSEKWSVNAGDNMHEIVLNNLAKGSYTVQLSNASGSTTIKTSVL